MQARSFYVYGYFDPRDEDVPFYIGKGCGARMFRHTEPGELARRDLFHSKLRSMLAKYIKPIIRVLHDNLDEETAFELEKHLIAGYGRRDNGTGCLCNLTDGGDGASGVIVSDEARFKRSLAHTGREVSIDTRVKQSRALRGRRPTPESLARMTEAQRARTLPVCRYDLKTGNPIEIYPSLTAARKKGFHSYSVGRVLRGLQPHHKGYGWRHA